MNDTGSQSSKTFKHHLQSFGGALLITMLTLVMLEGMLRLLDPWGTTYFDDLSTFYNDIFVPDEQRGYFIADGTYELITWQLNVADGGRDIPTQTNDTAPCEIIVLGDSVAFGYGVNDEDVWINHLAPLYPDVHFVNTGIILYNSANVLGTYEAFPDADAYVYLVLNNDINPQLDFETMIFSGDGGNQSWIIRYANFAIFQGGDDGSTLQLETGEILLESPNVTRFFTELEQITTAENVYLAAFENEPLTTTLLARAYAPFVIPYPATERISVADYHLNATGNELLAERLRPLFDEVVANECPM